MSDINSLCDMFKKTTIEYDEYEELIEALQLDCIRLYDIKKTDERYIRYLSIDWNINGISLQYIRNDIEFYLSIPTKNDNIFEKFKLMRQIDIQIIDIINKYC
jgi:hypothetical protein